MSLFGALDTAVSGLNAQAAAFGNISDDVANSQTVGFKGTNTAFVDYLSYSSSDVNDSGSVVARPVYTNNVQGTITQTSDPLGMAISGQGFFPVSNVIAANIATTGLPSFSTTPAYTRAGDFAMDKNGYLVNSAGSFLNGWSVNGTTGVVDRTKVSPIKIDRSVDSPVATSLVTLSANLPATPDASIPVTTQATVYDALGTQHAVTLNWTQNAASDWTVSVNVPDDATPARGTAEIKFGATSGNAVAEGTIGSIATATGNVTSAGYSAAGAATLSFTSDFGSGAQTFSLDLGSYGGSSGVTQFAGTAYTLNGITQNGVPPGNYSSVATTAQGDVVVSYDNGQSRTVARVPVVTFNNPDALQRKDGQAFKATLDSGAPRTQDAGSTGAGTLVTSSVEQSNVDISTQFTSLIVAQQAYSANTKVITTANAMLQQSIDMMR